MPTKIEWTNETWNPIVGCSKISAGCDNCYAQREARRQIAYKTPHYAGTIADGHWTGKIGTAPESTWTKPLRWKKPRRVFVCSMGDLFHENVPFETIAAVFAVMAVCPDHTFQVLTKRADRMAEFFEWVKNVAWPDLFPHGLPDYPVESNAVLRYAPELHDDGDYCRFIGDFDPAPWPLPNVWLGVSAENQATADERIPLLCQTPAAVRFLSAEPMLGPVDLEIIDFGEKGWIRIRDVLLRGFAGSTLTNETLDWVICGGESGPGARPMHPDWARALRDQCQTAGVPFFFKQWGAWHPIYGSGRPRGDEETEIKPFAWVDPTGKTSASGTVPDALMLRVGKKRAGRILDGRTWDEYPER